MFEGLFIANKVLVLALGRRFVELILREQKSPSRQEIVINIHWNNLRFLADNPKIMQAVGPELEEYVLPLYEFMQDPGSIEFDEDICLFISGLIKATGRVTQPQFKLFGLFPLMFEKYKHIFSFSFTPLSLIIGFGGHILAQYPDAIALLLRMISENLELTAES
jgi:hypothetical protein